MPCYQVITNTVSLPAMDPELRKRAIAELGWKVLWEDKTQLRLNASGVVATIRSGAFEIRAGYEDRADTLKVAYSKQVVKAAASRFGWAVKETAPNQFVAQRRF